jgi:hypothetical protein
MSLAPDEERFFRDPSLNDPRSVNKFTDISLSGK